MQCVGFWRVLAALLILPAVPAFKLGILKALRDQIDAGSRKWSDVVTLAKSKSGATYCMSVIWNGPTALDEGKAEAAYAAVMGKLARS